MAVTSLFIYLSIYLFFFSGEENKEKPFTRTFNGHALYCPKQTRCLKLFSTFKVKANMYFSVKRHEAEGCQIIFKKEQVASNGVTSHLSSCTPSHAMLQEKCQAHYTNTSTPIRVDSLDVVKTIN